MNRSIQAAFLELSSGANVYPRILNVTGGAAGATNATLNAVQTNTGIGSSTRRVHVANVGSAVGGVVWARTNDTSGTKFTGQDITTSTKIAAGGTLDFTCDASVQFGYVGVTDFSITVSEV